MAGMLAPEKAPQFLDSMLKRNSVVLISATYCTFCTRLKAMFIEQNIRFVSLEVDIIPNGRALFAEVQRRSNVNTVPQVFARQKFIGGYDDVMELGQKKLKETDTVTELQKLVNKTI